MTFSRGCIYCCCLIKEKHRRCSFLIIASCNSLQVSVINSIRCPHPELKTLRHNPEGSQCERELKCCSAPILQLVVKGKAKRYDLSDIAEVEIRPSHFHYKQIVLGSFQLVYMCACSCMPPGWRGVCLL